MIQVEQHGSVTVIRMARALLGRPLYWTAAYWLDGLLIDTTRSLIPPQHRADEIERRIASLARRGLIDQPPGEIERTIHGLGRRRPDRLHRAWLRGFFVPRGVVVPGVRPNAEG